MSSSNVSEIMIKRLPLTIDIIYENELKSLKIDTHNSLDSQFSSTSDINRFITIDYNRLKSNFIDYEHQDVRNPQDEFS